MEGLSIFETLTSGFTAAAKAQLAGLTRVGQVTTATSVTVFEATDLIGQGDDAFAGWYVYVLQSDNAAPENETQPMSDYVSSTGKVTHTALTAQLAVGDWVTLLHPSMAMLGAVDTSAATGAVTSTDFLMAYVKQIVTNTYRLGEAAIADTTDPVDMTTEVADDTILSNMLTDDGDTSTYDRRTDSQEAISDSVAKGFADEAVLHTVFRSEAALAIKNTNVDIMEIDAVAGTVYGLIIEFKVDNDAAATTYTPTLKMTSTLAPTTFTNQKLPAVATIAAPATAVGHYRYELGDIGQGLQAKLNLAQTNDGDATRIIEAVMTYRQ